MYRNDSFQQMVERVIASQDQLVRMDIDISGLNIDYPVKTLILKCYESGQPFGLADETGEYLVYFFSSHGVAIWCDGGAPTFNTFQDAKKFETAIKAALISHKTFVGIRQLQAHEQFREIVEQLKQIG